MQRLVTALGWVLAAVIALLVSTVVHARLPIAKRVAAKGLGTLVSSEIQGTLQVGRIERMALDGVTLRHVTLLDGEGTRIIVADRLWLAPDLSRWPAVRLSGARLERGTVRLVDDGEGLPTLLTSFDAPTQSPSSGEPLHVVVDGIELSEVTLYGDLLGLEGMRAERLAARGRMEIGANVRVWITDASATQVQPFPFEASIDRLRGTISTLPTQVALQARARRPGEEARVSVRYVDAPDERLTIDVDGTELQPETLQGLGFDWSRSILPRLTGKVRLDGPPEQLGVTSDLSTAAGQVSLEGQIVTDGPTRVTLRSDAVELDKAMRELPQLTVRGAVTIEAKPEEPNPRIYAEIDPLLYRKIAIPGFIVEAVIEPDAIRVEHLEGKRGRAEVEATGHIVSAEDFDLQVRIRAGDIAADESLRDLLPDVHAGLNADVHVRAPERGQRGLRLSGSVMLSNVRAGMVSARRLALNGRVDGDPDLPRLQLRARGSGVKVGEYQLGDASFAIKGAPGKYTAKGEFKARGRRTFQVDATIAADRHHVVIDADRLELVVGDEEWRGALQGLEVVHDHSVAVQLLRLANRTQRLEANGIVRFQGEDAIEAQLQNFDLRALRALLGETFPAREGFADSHLVVSGDIARPNVLLEGALREGVLYDIEGVQALYAVSYVDGRLDLDGEMDLGERGLVRARATGEVSPDFRNVREAFLDGHYQATIEPEDLDLALFERVQDGGVKGRVGGVVRFRGSPRRPDVSAALVVAPLDIEGVSSLSARTQVVYANNQLTGQATLMDEQGAFALIGADTHIDWDALLETPDLLNQVLVEGPWHVHGQTAQRRLDAMPEPLRVDLPLSVHASFDVQRDASQTTGHIVYEGTSAEPLEGSSCGAKIEPRLVGQIALLGEETRASLVGYAGKEIVAQLGASAATSLEAWIEAGHIVPPRQASASLSVDVPAMERLPYLCEQGSGSLKAELTLDAGADVAPKLQGIIESSFVPRPQRLAQGVMRLRSCSDDPVRAYAKLSADGTAASITGEITGCHGGPVSLRGSLPLTWAYACVPRWQSTQPVEAEARFDDAQLRPLLQRIPGLLGGEARANGRVNLTGTVEQPNFSGELDVDDGRVYIVATGQELDDLSAALKLRGNWAKVERLHTRSGNGTLDVSGGIGFTGLVPERLQLALVAKNLGVQREGIEIGWLTGDAALDADVGEDKARTAIKVHELEVRLPDRIDRTLQPLDPHPEVRVVTEEAPAVMTPYPIELAIDGTRGIRIVRNDLTVNVTAEIAVVYADPDLFVGGRIELLGGEIDVLGKRFMVEQGSIRFDGSNEFDPEVRLIAEHQPEIAGGSPVAVSVLGTFQEPEVTFSSNACPGSGGAVMYLLSGQCTADDPELAAETEAAEDAYASAMVGALGAVLSASTSSLGGGLVPRVSVESAGEGTGTRIKAGVDLLPSFMRSFVRRVYIQGASRVDLAAQDGADAEPNPADNANDSPLSPDFLIELYFPYGLVGSGRYAPGRSWGLDLAWEP